MAAELSSDLCLIPDEMLKFVLGSSHRLLQAPRLGQLFSHGCPAIHTPHYVAATSRGVIPHLSHDVLQKHTDISATYMGLEDFIEKSCHDAPVLKTPTKPGESALRKFTALPSQCLSILGPRRVPPIATPVQNTDSSIAICTSVGFRTLELSDYIAATSTLRPDVSATLPDLPSGEKISKRRIEKSADRTHAWLQDILSHDASQMLPIFAAIPSLEAEQQQLYLSDLCEDYLDSLSGLCIYDPSTIPALPPQLSRLPILCISDPPNPHALLHAISLGVDLMTVPFITTASEQGIALTFTFPPQLDSTIQALASRHFKHPLGIDLFSPTHATSLSPLSSSPYISNSNSTPSQSQSQSHCTCYTCRTHHRAYLHHLLSAREMLAWTLLQIHNFHVLSTFFSNLRNSIRNGTFDTDRKAFEDYYSEDFGIEDARKVEVSAGELEENALEGARDIVKQSNYGESERGPRLRGYQMKSVGRGEDKKREKVWGRFDQKLSPSHTPASEEQASPSRAVSSAGTGTPAEVSLGTENDQALKVAEAKEQDEEIGADGGFVLGGERIEKLGLAEKEGDVRK